MIVKLMAYSPLKLAITAARTCYDSSDLATEEKDEQLLKNILAYGHESVIEHLNYTFDVQGISRGCLQQVVRHRIGCAYSVQSTRYTLKKKFKKYMLKDLYVPIGDVHIDNVVEGQLSYIRSLVLGDSSVSFKNDNLKYALPEAYKTDMIVTMNARSLRHFLKLRLDKQAHWEIRELATQVYEQIPQVHKFLFEDLNPCMEE